MTVILAGSGIGDINNVTIGVLELVKKADAILYDALIPKELLEYKKESCELIYVGKRAGSHYMKQDEINKKIYEVSKKYDLVLRLKGGDPFVFGRGGEEYLYLKERGVKVEVIPGISSSIAAPLLNLIPVTHRSVSKSFTVITGHEENDDTIDYEALVKLNGTIIILMGIGATKKITDKLLKSKMNPNTPLAFLERADLPDSRCIKTTLIKANSVKEKEDVKTPGIIIIGDVVNILD